MFVVDEDMTLHLTRGDVAIFPLSAETEDGTEYTFCEGDVIRFKVIEKKKCNNVVLVKDFIVEEEKQIIDIFLDEEDTKIGEIINKPTDYWYEVELNPDQNVQTIVCYDENGAKVLRLYPEGEEEQKGEI